MKNTNCTLSDLTGPYYKETHLLFCSNPQVLDVGERKRSTFAVEFSTYPSALITTWKMGSCRVKSRDIKRPLQEDLVSLLRVLLKAGVNRVNPSGWVGSTHCSPEWFPQQWDPPRPRVGRDSEKPIDEDFGLSRVRP